MQHLVFDFDGVLIDSRKAVKDAYRVAGVEMPDSAWGQPWHTWLPRLVGPRAIEVHKLKNLAYRGMLFAGRVPSGPGLPVFQLALRHPQAFWPCIITGASYEAATPGLQMLDIPHRYLSETGCQPHDKVIALQRIASSGVYFDDLYENHYIAIRAGWRFSHLHNEESAKEAIRWMQSFLRPDGTNV